MEGEIKVSREVVLALKAELRSKSARLAAIRGEVGTNELRERVAALEIKKAEIGKRLDVLGSGGVKLITSEERETVEKEFVRWSREKAARIKAFRELESVFLDGMRREELWVSSTCTASLLTCTDANRRKLALKTKRVT